MNKILIIVLIACLLLTGIFILHKTSSGYKKPIPTIQYDKPIGPLMQDGEFYSKYKEVLNGNAT